MGTQGFLRAKTWIRDKPGHDGHHPNDRAHQARRQRAKETIDFTPSELISARRSGAMVPRPPIMMPRLPKLAKPHIA